MTLTSQIEVLSFAAFATLKARGQKLCTVESCTGGMISAAITQYSGSSAVFDYGFVTYANEAKTALVGVDAGLLAQMGAVSLDVAQAMAEGGLERSGADFCLSVTGIAGPTGGSTDKPVGLVFIGLASKASPTQVQKHLFEDGGRQNIREQATLAAFNLLKQNLT